MIGQQPHELIWTLATGALAHSVRTGFSGMTQIEPRGMWAYFETRPEEARVFGEAMAAKAAADVVAVLAAYDFSDVVVGGGRGHLMRAVLDAAPDTKGVLVDLPAVIDELDVTHERLDTVAADFFVDPLPSADVYLLMEVLHDWADPEAAAILTAIRRVSPPGARVLVIENMLDDDHPDTRGHVLDVIMMAVAGGRERTVSKLTALLGRAGFSGATTYATQGPMRILEAHLA